MRCFLRFSFLTALVLVAVGCSTTPTAAPRKKAFTFVQICDPQLGMGGYEHDVKTFEQAVKQVNALKPDFAVICGDLVGRANEKSVKDFNRIKAGFKVPCHLVPGNHDVFHGPHDRRAGLKPTQSLAHYRKSFGKDYYSFEHKGYMFVCVNTQLWRVALEGESEKHNAWFVNELKSAESRRLPVFVIAHHPVYLKNPDEKDGYYNLPIARRKTLLALFEKHGVVAVLTGHAHKIIINDYKGIQLVTGQSTSRTAGSPLGFRLWYVTGTRPFKHESIDLETKKK